MTLPSWWDKTGRKQNAATRQQEARRARETGGRVQAGSGSSWRARGDVKTDTDLEELKRTAKDSYSLKAEDLKEHLRRSLVQGREPTFLVDFQKHGLRVIITLEEL